MLSTSHWSEIGLILRRNWDKSARCVQTDLNLACVRTNSYEQIHVSNWVRLVCRLARLVGVLNFKEEFFRTTFRRIFFLRGGIIKVCEACVEIITFSVVYTYLSSNFLGDSLMGVVSVKAEWVDDDDLAAVDRKRCSVQQNTIKLCRLVTHCTYLC